MVQTSNGKMISCLGTTLITYRPVVSEAYRGKRLALEEFMGKLQSI
ncbi:hypothetical protein ACFLVI_01600 [Chloroflexota bacterium]